MAGEPRLEGKVALITGAARGMGAAIARRFVDEGAHVVLGDVLTDELAQTAAAIEVDAPGTTETLDLDVTSDDDWKAAVALALERFDGLNVLVNNAGVTGNAHGSLIDE